MSERLSTPARILRLVFLLMLPLAVGAQESSPYSRYGLGLLSDFNFVPSNSMGGLGAAFRGPEGISFSNPASISGLTLTTMEVGIYGYTQTRKTASASATNGSATLNYLSVGFPVGKRWAMASGLIPFSRQDNFTQDTLEFGDNRGKIERESEGGLYNFFWGNAFKYKDFSVGVNIAYLFGSISGNTVAYPLDQNGLGDLTSFSTWDNSTLRVKSFYWNAGVQYHRKFYYGPEDNKHIKLTLGLSGNPRFNIGNRSGRDESIYMVDSRNLAFKNEAQSYGDFLGDLLINAPSEFDTVRIAKDIPTTVTIPGYIQTGFTLSDSIKWMVGFDFRYQPWTQFQSFRDNETANLQNSWRVGAGGEFLPKAKADAKFFAKLKYRAGFSYQRTQISVSNTPINEFGINVGFAIPMLKRLYDEYNTRVLIYAFHFGVEAGSRGTLDNNLVKENFVRFRLGINLNDKWFMKRKYY
jgi:hypothetical protein